MSDTVDIAWLRDRLATSAGISDARAGELIHRAMSKGTLKAVADHATRRPESSATYHTNEDFGEDDFAIPETLWESVEVNWNDRRPYFRFFYKRQVWLASSLTVDRAIAVAFLRANDPLLSVDAALSAPGTGSSPKSKGGRPAKYDWASAGGALAGHMHGTGIQENTALKAYLFDWFQAEHGKVPDERDVEKFVAAALSAFELATSKR